MRLLLTLDKFASFLPRLPVVPLEHVFQAPYGPLQAIAKAEILGLEIHHARRQILQVALELVTLQFAQPARLVPLSAYGLDATACTRAAGIGWATNLMPLPSPFRDPC